LRVTDDDGHEFTLHACLHRARSSRIFDARRQRPLTPKDQRTARLYSYRLP
jgi:hypothetical protein